MKEDTCLFCKIVLGLTGAAIVHESQDALVFLDHRPLFPGHCLVIPREHFETLVDLPSETLGRMFTEVQLAAGAVQSAMEAQGTLVAMNNRVSQSVPHLHVHVVPRKKGDGLRGFFWPRTKYESTVEMEEIRQRIAEEIRKSSHD